MSLDQLLSLNVPTTKHSETTFLDIARMPHYEDVITRLYAWFIDEQNVRLHGDWLKEAFFKLIEQRTFMTFSIRHYEVQPQVIVRSRLKLDLVITITTVQDEKITIIIENKIYHTLNNDLQAYYDAVGFDSDHKFGIVLSLTPQVIPDLVKDKFFNVLHKEVISKISMGKVNEIADLRMRIYAKDFIQNLNNLNRIFIMNDAVEFYFNNAKVVNNAISCKEETIKYISSEIRIAGERLGLIDSKFKEDDDYRYLSETNEDDIFYTVIYEQLFAGEKEIQIAIEITRTALKHIDRFIDTIKSNYIGKLKILGVNERTYAYLLSFKYSLSLDEMKELGTFIFTKIRSDFEPIYQQLKLERLKLKTA